MARGFKTALRKVLRHHRKMARLRKWLAEPLEPVPPCPRCHSTEGCEADCPVAPWNMEP